MITTRLTTRPVRSRRAPGRVFGECRHGQRAESLAEDRRGYAGDASQNGTQPGDLRNSSPA